MVDVLNQKYGIDRKQQNIAYLDEFFKDKRGKEESVLDYVSQFDFMSQSVKQ